MVDKKRLIRLAQSLIAINSENPPGNESAIARFVQGYLKGLGIKSKIYAFKKERSNVVAVLRGEGRKRSLLITPHLDTVPAGRNWSRDPFKGKVEGGRIYGLGATDCKGNLAASLEAINSLIEDKAVLNYDLVFAATADEESGSSLGLIPLLDKGILKVDAALVLDADDFEVIITQKGLMHIRIIIKGKKAHGAYPWLGINAIDIALEILYSLKKHRFSSLKNDYLKPPTLNIGTIRGGDKVNVVADWCEFELDFRFLPGTNHENILKDLKKIIKARAKKFKVEIDGIQAPYSIDKGHFFVKSFIRTMKEAGISPRLKGSEGATVITFFQDKGIPAIASGFGSAGCAHTHDEFIGIDNLYKGTLLLANFLKNFQFNK
ncbi:MAG: M20 family metallopeptidase [Candidatus Omnitrophica bacterium]|nr:M20 family metallopeptidase [Candidatus Omnitrophota bacterium]